MSADINADFFHNGDGIRMDNGGMRSCAEYFETVAGNVAKQPLRHLGTAGISGTDKNNFFLFHGKASLHAAVYLSNMECGFVFCYPNAVLNFHMPEHEKESFDPLFSHPLEPASGLTVSDLNRYLAAVQTVGEIKQVDGELSEGLYHGDAITGLKKLPDNSIDLIITKPPEYPKGTNLPSGGRMTLQDYYAWNESWLKEAFRVLKNTGSIYLFCGWRLSGMYHGLLSNQFKVQTRITWKNRRASQSSEQYRNEIGDIWFAAKTKSFLFRDENKSDKSGTNLWPEIFSDEKDSLIPKDLHARILQSNSFKLNWVLDPFMGKGSTGAAAKSLGRRFIGIDLDKDRVILSMKKIDQT